MTMTREEAQRQVARVRDGLRQANNALLVLHSGRGWAALGYASFAAMCDGEFGLSPQRASQKLDHARTVLHMAEVLGLDDAATAEVERRYTERLHRDVKDHTAEVIEGARRHLESVPEPASDRRAAVDTGKAVRHAAADVRAAVTQRPAMRLPRMPEQGRRPAQPGHGFTPYDRVMVSGRNHLEHLTVMTTGGAALADVEKMQVLELREQIIAAYETLTSAWAGEPLAAGRPAMDPFLPPAAAQ